MPFQSRFLAMRWQCDNDPARTVGEITTYPLDSTLDSNLQSRKSETLLHYNRTVRCINNGPAFPHTNP